MVRQLPIIWFRVTLNRRSGMFFCSFGTSPKLSWKNFERPRYLVLVRSLILWTSCRCEIRTPVSSCKSPAIPIRIFKCMLFNFNPVSMMLPLPRTHHIIHIYVTTNGCLSLRRAPQRLFEGPRRIHSCPICSGSLHKSFKNVLSCKNGNVWFNWDLQWTRSKRPY